MTNSSADNNSSADSLVDDMLRLRMEQVAIILKPWSPGEQHPSTNAKTPEGGWRMEASVYAASLQKCDDALARATAAAVIARNLKHSNSVNAAAEVLRSQREVAYVKSVTNDFLIAVAVVPDGTNDRITSQLAEKSVLLRKLRDDQIRAAVLPAPPPTI